MMQIVPNSGLFNSPQLDEMRAQAITALVTNALWLPPEVIEYLNALERAHLQMLARQKEASAPKFWQQFEAP